MSIRGRVANVAPPTRTSKETQTKYSAHAESTYLQHCHAIHVGAASYASPCQCRSLRGRGCRCSRFRRRTASSGRSLSGSGGTRSCPRSTLPPGSPPAPAPPATKSRTRSRKSTRSPTLRIRAAPPGCTVSANSTKSQT